MLNTSEYSAFLDEEIDMALAQLRHWNRKAETLLQLKAEFLRLVDRDRAFVQHVDDSIKGSEEAYRELLKVCFGEKKEAQDGE